MFDITGDEIRYNRIPFAKIEGQTSVTQRAEAESELLNGPDGWVSEDAHSIALDEAREEGAREYERPH